MSSGVLYRITEEDSARKHLRLVAKILIDTADKTPVGKLAPDLPQSTWILGQGGQVKGEDGQMKPLWWTSIHVLSADIALVKKFQEDFTEWQKQVSKK